MAMIKLSAFAEQMSVNYQTAWQWYNNGKIVGIKLATGTILIDPIASIEKLQHPNEPEKKAVNTVVSSATTTPQPTTNTTSIIRPRAIVYTRIDKGATTDKDIQKATSITYEYATSRGYQIVEDILDRDSGYGERKELKRILANPNDWDVLVAYDTDIVSLFDYELLETLLNNMGKTIDVKTKNTSMSNHIYLTRLINTIHALLRPMIGISKQRKEIFLLIQNLIR